MSQAKLIRSGAIADIAGMLCWITASFALMVIGIRAYFAAQKPAPQRSNWMRKMKLIKVLAAALLAWLAILMNLGQLQAQSSSMAWPQWLQVPEGVKAERQVNPGLITVQYRVNGKPDEAAQQLSAAFAAAKLAYQPQADGIGLSARVAAPECDLLLQFHPSQGGTQVNLHCAAKTQVSNGFYVPPQGYRPSMTRSTPITRQSLENFEREQQARMARYDQPQPVAAISMYANDAPALAWPIWFGRLDGRALAPATRQSDNPYQCLVSKYVDNQTDMSVLVSSYKNMVEGSGFRVARTNLQTGQTWNGKMVQNKSGVVEGVQSSDGRVNGPSTRVMASFNREVLNGPITVTLRVCVKGSFGNN